MYHAHIPLLDGLWEPLVHASCAHNLITGLACRTMSKVTGPTVKGVEMFDKAIGIIASICRSRMGTVEPLTYNQVVESYVSKRMRNRYQQALDTLNSEGLCTRKDSKVSAFVKAEKLAGYKTHKPRVIMGRSPRYNLELATFLKPLEHCMYSSLRGWNSRFLTRTRLIGKGLNSEGRADLIRRKFQSKENVVAFEVDCKSFESHVSLSQLRGEHSVYTKLCPNTRLRQLLAWQERFTGVGPGGVEFTIEGKRASGDFNTGLGNTLIMCAMVLATAKRLGKQFDFVADGDNAVLFVLRKDLTLWKERLQMDFKEMGHDLDVGETANQLEKVVFGQSKPCLAAGRWVMVRNPEKVLSHASSSHEHFSNMRGGIRVLRAIAYCEAHLSRGVPVLQEYARSLWKATIGAKMARGARFDDPTYRSILDASTSECVTWAEVTSEARLTFADAWGIGPEEQIKMEQELRKPINLPSDWSSGNGAMDIDVRDPSTLPDSFWAANFM